MADIAGGIDSEALVSSAVESSGELALSVDLSNAGERMLTLSVWVEVYDKAGAKLGKFDGRDVRLYPDTSSRSTITLGSLVPGSYRVIVVADNHDEYVAAVRTAWSCRHLDGWRRASWLGRAKWSANMAC